LVRIGQNGVATNTGFVLPGTSTAWSGAFNDDDGYFYVATSHGVNTWVIDVSGTTPTLVRQMPQSAAENVFDFTYADGFFWGMNGDGIRRINPSTGASQFFPVPDSWGTRGGTYGAAWVFGNGNLGFSRNSGSVYQVSVENPASANPTFTLVGSQPGPASIRNDGAAIPGLPTDLEVEKDGPARLLPGGQISYDITVRNHGPGVSSGWIVHDAFPEGLSDVVVSGDVVSQVIDGRHVISGGRLAAGAERTFTVTANVDPAVEGCVTNVATILANEEDPNSENNDDSSTACVAYLEITKSSDVTPDARPGDTVTYTITARNAGSADYTDENPAVVFDDLSAVLDDASFNDDAAANRAGALTYEAPLLSWTGALPAGESVEITYTATLGAGGDGEVRNVAWQPEDPENPEPPACDPADEDGLDPDTGEPCAVVEYDLPKLTIDKVADRFDLPAAGETITYTITVTNVGPGDYTAAAPATMTDDLSDVIDDATLDEGSLDATEGEVSYDAPTLSWEGALASGESAEISYTVTYNGEGDQQLVNLACVPEDELAAGARACDTVTVPGSGLKQWKTVDASDDPVVAGSELTYTLHFENDGNSDATVDAIDFLTHVLDDADVTSEPASDVLNVDRDGEEIAITGTVPTGDTATVSYTVTINADGERGDDVAANFLLNNDEDNPPTPPADPVCEPSPPDFPDCTSTPIGGITYDKSVTADSESVGAGTVLTYEITINSTGTATMPVDREDVLTDVLDDATIVSQPTSDSDSVTVSEIADDRFSIGGELAGGETAIVSYSVVVNGESERGNDSAVNFLVPVGEDPPSECVEGDGSCTVTPLPNVGVAKSVDPASGSSVVAGQELTYTLTFTNSGNAAGPVDFTDVLADVLDDADVTSVPEASSDDLTVSEVADGEFTVTGSLDAGQSETVTYTVTVKADGERGDNVLGNFVVPTGTTPPDECVEGSAYCTTNPVPQIDSWKTVEANESPVAAGTELTYTLHFENTGAASGTVDMVDDLTHVLDDAEVTSEPEASDSSWDVSRAEEVISISGDLAAGETATVTYTVTVLPDGERGDDVAANFLLGPDEEPPADPVCQPTNPDQPDCTVTPIGRLLVTKAVSSEDDPVVTGSTLTYTLTFDNQGEAPVEVDHTDHLADVLDDATIADEPVASDDALQVTPVDGDSFSVTGELAAGQAVTVSYSVVVNGESERGNDSAVNFLVPVGEDPPSECVEGDGSCTVTPLPNVGVAKSVDPASGSSVVAGQELTYTLTFTNSGNAAGPVDFTDVLADVLDDADVTSVPEASSDDLTVSEVADGEFTVTGSLDAGQSETVTYTVTVKADGERGDNVLGNFVVPTGTTPPDECVEGSAYCTTNPVPQIDSWKTVDPASATPVVEGQELTYTLHFENTGAASGTVDMVDDLTHVLDDADVTVEPAASIEAWEVTRAEEVISISGDLAAGETATVTYTVTVKGSNERGDDVLANYLLAPGEEPPTDPVCEPADEERPNCTVNPVGDILPAKTVNPESGSTVEEGQEVTYTLSFENTGKGAATIDYVDHMADVLDDAVLTGDISTTGGAQVAGPLENQLLISGTVQPGETATVAYTVTVKPYDDQGDHHLGNFLTVAEQVPPAECVEGNPLCTQNPIDPPPSAGSPSLPGTGAQIALGTIAAALLATALGTALVWNNRRRTE